MAEATRTTLSDELDAMADDASRSQLTLGKYEGNRLRAAANRLRELEAACVAAMDVERERFSVRDFTGKIVHQGPPSRLFAQLEAAVGGTNKKGGPV